MKRGLIDEFRLCLVPVVLGNGTPLFKPDAGQHRMRLLEARPLATGGTILRLGAERKRSRGTRIRLLLVVAILQ